MSLDVSQIQKIFIVALAIKAVTESWLDRRQQKHILEHRSSVPERFQSAITLAEHQKAADYSIAKINAGHFFRIYEVIVLYIWTLGGGLNGLNTLLTSDARSSVLNGVLFFAAFGLINMIIGLPQSIYSTFVIEEKFGFNKTTPKIFITDIVKGIVLGALIGLPILAGLIKILESLGDQWWVWGWGFLTAVQLVIIWAYPRIIAPLFNKFTPLEEGEVKDVVLKLLERTGFKSNGLFVMDASKRSTHGNAYFTGFGNNKRIVFFDNLIKGLTPKEVEAVLAHELGHFKRKHIVKGLAKSMLMSFIGFYILSVMYQSQNFYSGHGVQLPNSTVVPHLGLVLFALVSSVYTFWLTPISSWFSRKYEFEADHFASQFSSAEDLITALVKLYKENASTLTPDPVYSAFYHSHPPASIRVEHLKKLQSSGAN
ncbi:MAG: M48 family metallopeptidase [Bacteriovoracaceae bacterium]